MAKVNYGKEIVKELQRQENPYGPILDLTETFYALSIQTQAIFLCLNSLKESGVMKE